VDFACEDHLQSRKVVEVGGVLSMEESRCDDAGNGGNALHSVGGYFSGRIESGLLLAGTRGKWLRPVDMTRSRTCVPVGPTCRAREIRYPQGGCLASLRRCRKVWFGLAWTGDAKASARARLQCRLLRDETRVRPSPTSVWRGPAPMGARTVSHSLRWAD
jgi:hypothetical protein